MSEIVDAYVATFKAGQGYDAPWLVIHAPNPEQFKQRLDSVSDGLLHQLAQISATFQAITTVEKKVGPTTLAGPSSAPQQGVAPSTAPQQAAAPAQPVPNNVVPLQPADGRRYSPNGTVCSKCSEPLYWQEWTTKAGNAAKAYKCGGKGFGHDIEWPEKR